MAKKWIVQAMTPEYTWVDVQDADNRAESERLAERLRSNESAWIKGRPIRVVPSDYGKPSDEERRKKYLTEFFMSNMAGCLVAVVAMLILLAIIRFMTKTGIGG